MSLISLVLSFSFLLISLISLRIIPFSFLHSANLLVKS
jgi:hypothetical protein